jgi:hypothetical protein
MVDNRDVDKQPLDAEQERQRVNLIHLQLKDVAALDERGVDQQMDADVSTKDYSGKRMEAPEQKVVFSAEQGDGRIGGCRRGHFESFLK